MIPKEEWKWQHEWNHGSPDRDPICASLIESVGKTIVGAYFISTALFKAYRELPDRYETMAFRCMPNGKVNYRELDIACTGCVIEARISHEGMCVKAARGEYDGIKP